MTEPKDERAERLKAALRANLRRRKAQGRGRAEVRSPAGADEHHTRESQESEAGGPDSDKSKL